MSLLFERGQAWRFQGATVFLPFCSRTNDRAPTPARAIIERSITVEDEEKDQGVRVSTRMEGEEPENPRTTGRLADTKTNACTGNGGGALILIGTQNMFGAPRTVPSRNAGPRFTSGVRCFCSSSISEAR